MRQTDKAYCFWLKSVDSAVLCFCVRPTGGSAELKLCTHPKGSVSGFTMVQIPVMLTLHSPEGTQHISTTASLSASPAPPAAPRAAPVPTPIITGTASSIR